MPPPVIGSTLLASYDASTLALANNDPVNTWPDDSGNNFDLTAVLAPVFVSSALNTMGGVRFDTLDRLRVTGITSHTNATFFIVSINPSDGNATPAYFNDQLARKPFFAKWTNNGRWIWGVADTGGFFIEFTDGSLLDQPCIWTGTIQATGAILRANQVQKVSGNLAGVGATTGLEIGNNGVGDWTVCEYLVYDGIASGGDIDTIEDYLFNKWFVAPPPNEGSGSGAVDWAGSATGTAPFIPPAGGGNRMGGTGAIRKPPRSASSR